MSADVHSENVPGVMPDLRRVRGEFDASRLASAPHLNLRLDDHGISSGVGGRNRFINRVGYPTR